MSKIAVDIVILPPKYITERIITLNKKAGKRGQARGPLGKRDFYPHISLAMGILKERDIQKFKKIISTICKNFSSFPMTSSCCRFSLKNDGTKAYVLKIKKTKKLQQLHELLMKELKPYFSYRGTAKELFKKKGEIVKPPEYVNQFRKKYSFKNFFPHITLRVKEIPVKNFEIHFTAKTLALCYMGAGGTCRKIFFQTKLKSKV